MNGTHKAADQHTTRWAYTHARTHARTHTRTHVGTIERDISRLFGWADEIVEETSLSPLYQQLKTALDRFSGNSGI